MENFYFAGLIQSLFFVVLILTKKNKRLSDYVLAFFIFVLGQYLFFIYSVQSGLYEAFPTIALLDIYYWTVLGPSLLLYTQLITSGNRLHKYQLLYLLPTVIVSIGFYKFIFVDPVSFFTGPAPDSWLFAFARLVWLYNSPLFYVLTIIYLKHHANDIRNYYSYSENVDLKWLYFLSNGFAIFLFFLLGSGLIKEYIYPSLPSSISYTWVVMVLYIFGIGFYGYKQKGVFSNTEEAPTKDLPDSNHAAEIDEPNVIKPSKISYEKSGLTTEEAEDLSARLLKLMEDEQPFLDCEINLASVAEKLGTSTHKLSQVINENLGKNFFDFINNYRIEKAKDCLLDPEYKDLKIITLAFECGFNSKSTFYNVFKKFTSLTPAEYRQKNEVPQAV